MPRKKTLELVSERRRLKRLAETPEQRRQRLDSLNKNTRASRLRKRINQLQPEQNLVENLPEPGIEPKMSGSMDNMCYHEELETGQRPSRKAALVAAKKIFNAAHNYVVKDGLQDLPASTTACPKPKKTVPVNVDLQMECCDDFLFSTTTCPKPRKTAPVNVDLQMECCDDLLSPIQAEFLIKAQVQYNMTMKNLRELMACNVKVIETDPFALPTAVAPVPNVALKTINVPSNITFSRTKPIKVGTLIVPISYALSQSPPKL